MAVDITWLFGFNTFKEVQSTMLYGTWITLNKSFKDFYDHFQYSNWGGGSGSGTYPTIATLTVGSKKIKGFGTYCSNYSGIRFKNTMRKDPNKRTYFGYRLTANWRNGVLVNFTSSGIQGPDGTGVPASLNVADLGLAGATSSIYIEHVLTPNYSGSTLVSHNYDLFVNGVLKRSGLVPKGNEIRPLVGSDSDGLVFSYGVNFLISDCYEGEQLITEELTPFGSLEVTGHPVTNVSNDKEMTLQGSSAANVVEEMNFFWDPATFQDKTSNAMLSNMGVENIFSFEEVSSSVVGATIRSSYNRGNSANGRVSLTPITNAGAGESSVFTPPTELSKDFEVVNIPLKGELTSINVNAFKIKVETVK